MPNRLIHDVPSGAPSPGPVAVSRMAKPHVMIETPVSSTEKENKPVVVSLHSPEELKGSG